MKSKMRTMKQQKKVFMKSSFRTSYSMRSTELCNSSIKLRFSKNFIFRVNNTTFQSFQNFDLMFICRCSIEYVCLLHWNKYEIDTLHVRSVEIDIENEKSTKIFSIIRRIIRREIDIS